MTAVATNGVDISAPSGPMVLCPDASGSGQLTQRYPSANQVTLWVNGILDRLIPGPGQTAWVYFSRPQGHYVVVG